MFGCTIFRVIPYALPALISVVLTYQDPSPHGDCFKKNSFALTLLGRRQPDGQWNITYDLSSSSCDNSQQWKLILHQNIMKEGNMRQVHLRGYFVDSESLTTDGDASQLIHFNKFNSVDYSQQRETVGGSSLITRQRLQTVSRLDWNAKPPQKNMNPWKHPVRTLRITDVDGNCSTVPECAEWMQKQQVADFRWHGDLTHNFYVAGDGRIYEGLGWYITNLYEFRFMYMKSGSNPPTKEQFLSLGQLIREGHLRGSIKAEYVSEGVWWPETKKAILELATY